MPRASSRSDRLPSSSVVSSSGSSTDRAELARRAIGGYPSGPAAAAGATTAALAGVPEPTAMILVEGVSDQIAVETLAARRHRDLRDERVAVVPMGGAGGIRRVLAEHTAATMQLVALCDAAEASLVRRAIATSPRQVSLFVCDPDLEVELIRAVGVDGTLAILESQRDLGSFDTFQKQVRWRDRPVEAQLRRFLGAGARRKLRYARLLTEAAVDRDRPPGALVAALDASLR